MRRQDPLAFDRRFMPRWRRRGWLSFLAEPFCMFAIVTLLAYGLGWLTAILWTGGGR